MSGYFLNLGQYMAPFLSIKVIAVSSFLEVIVINRSANFRNK
jgi:hypothetical protein